MSNGQWPCRQLVNVFINRLMDKISIVLGRQGEWVKCGN